MLLQDKEKTDKGLQAAQTRAMEAALLLKEAVEVNTRTQKDLRIQTDQVYELHRQQHSSGAPPSL